MNGTLRGDGVVVSGDARQRFHDARGYGRADGDEVTLARVEAAHLLYRGDLDAVDGAAFRAFFADSVAAVDRFAARFLVYADLRERGFYVAPARDGWPGAGAVGDPAVDLVVFARGEKPGGEVAHRVRVAGERQELPAADLAGRVLAVVDEESEVTYFDCGSGGGFAGATEFDSPAGVDADLMDDRVVCWDPPEDLYESGFYGQPVAGRDAAVVDALHLSLVEAADLADRDALSLDAEAVCDRGRAVEGERFDRRLSVYRQLRDRGVVPKTGYKFGADFRTYDAVESVSDLPHSEALVRVVQPDHRFHLRDLAEDVRLAGGVRKRMVFALAGDDSLAYLTVARLTP
ncbi:tRNA-intron lyase [Candidatus Halobonum tyrrellensis]|uniref:tRNA-splicing endonuclease n=1 Tax=Candidatus Halobonum tyrrellensis G22 TaxID=1324957 RepID=V4IXS3_9EURY|nr:tRNA-intron lyase [Candidatus Halobonum tyrrellensis]ESP87962.1 tRNA splicing endonuclease [Candidatus Halobonum tyrrellensis G22]